MASGRQASGAYQLTVSRHASPARTLACFYDSIKRTCAVRGCRARKEVHMGERAAVSQHLRLTATLITNIVLRHPSLIQVGRLYGNSLQLAVRVGRHCSEVTQRDTRSFCLLWLRQRKATSHSLLSRMPVSMSGIRISGLRYRLIPTNANLTNGACVHPSHHDSSRTEYRLMRQRDPRARCSGRSIDGHVCPDVTDSSLLPAIIKAESSTNRSIDTVARSTG
jgi:hypothetical protein